MITGYSIGQALHEGTLSFHDLTAPTSHLRLPPLSPDLRYLLALSKEFLQGDPPNETRRQQLLLDSYRDQTLLVGPQTERVVELLDAALEPQKPPPTAFFDSDIEPDPASPNLPSLARQVWENSRKQAAGSGGLKRSLLAAFFFLNHPKRLAQETLALCAQTHPDPRCLDASLFASRLLRMLLLDQWHEHRHTALCLVGIGPTVTQAIQSAPMLPLQALDPNGYVVTSLQAAYRTLLLQDPPHLRLIALLQRKGPYPTLGLVAGAFLGALFGPHTFPHSWNALLPASSAWHAIAHTIPSLSPQEPSA